ncbi:MAG: chlorite dismutase [Dehalococcoidia bacterium]|nr:MAG: chlorite dismutase [Dehalococcoidia bacterium]
MTATHPSPRGHASAHPAGETPRAPRGVQSVKFTFFRMPGEARRLPQVERAALADNLLGLLDASGESMLTRAYTVAGTRGDVDVLLWQVHDDLRVVMDWHSALRASSVGAWLETPHSYLSMTMRSLYTNPRHEGAASRERLRTDGGTDEFLFVYPMAKTRAWYALAASERQRMMDEHIAVGHKYHDIKINTTYSYGLDDQEFVVAFEGNDPGSFLALVRELRDSEASAYTLFDTPMFTCRRIPLGALPGALGLG